MTWEKTQLFSLRPCVNKPCVCHICMYSSIVILFSCDITKDNLIALLLYWGLGPYCRLFHLYDGGQHHVGTRQCRGNPRPKTSGKSFPIYWRVSQHELNLNSMQPHRWEMAGSDTLMYICSLTHPFGPKKWEGQTSRGLAQSEFATSTVSSILMSSSESSRLER